MLTLVVQGPGCKRYRSQSNSSIAKTVEGTYSERPTGYCDFAKISAEKRQQLSAFPEGGSAETARHKLYCVIYCTHLIVACVCELSASRLQCFAMLPSKH